MPLMDIDCHNCRRLSTGALALLIAAYVVCSIGLAAFAYIVGRTELQFNRNMNIYERVQQYGKEKGASK